MTEPVYDQNGYRYYAEDSNHTALADENASMIIDADVKFMIRIEIEVTNAKAALNRDFELWGSRNGGTYASVVPTSPCGILSTSSSAFTDGDADNVDRLTSSSLTFTAGELDQDALCGDGGNFDFTGLDHCEAEFAIQIDSGNAVGGDYWDLELRTTGGAQLDAYQRRPRVQMTGLAGATELISGSVWGIAGVSPTGTIGLAFAGAPCAIGSVSPTVVRSPAMSEQTDGLASVSPTATSSRTLVASSLGVTSPLGRHVIEQAFAGQSIGAIAITDPYLVTLTGQWINPASDGNIGLWTDEGGGTASIYKSVDEETYACMLHTDFIKSEVNPDADVCVLDLESAGDPGVDNGFVLWVAYKRDTTDTAINLKVELLQNAVVIASTQKNGISDSITILPLDITDTEAANITDFNALKVRLTANPA